MRLQLLIFHVLIALLCTKCQSPSHSDAPKEVEFTLIKFHLTGDAEGCCFGGIDGTIDFLRDTSYFVITDFTSKKPISSYKLSKLEIDTIQALVRLINFPWKPKSERFTVTDQSTSNTMFCRGTDTFSISDYGLNGDQPLQDIYKIVYKIPVNH